MQSIIRWIAILLVPAVLFAAPAGAQDQPEAQAAPVAASTLTPEAMIAELPDADYDRKAEIVNALAMSGFPRALSVIDALAGGTLFSAPDGKVVYQTGAAYTDALTGMAVSGLTEDQLNKVGVNNRLRRDLRALSSRLSMASSDDSVRRAAAQSAFASQDEASLPAIEEAYAKEKVSGIKKLLAQARAAIILNSDAAADADKLAAIEVLKERGDQDSASMLLAAAGDGSAAVSKAAADAASVVQNSLSYWDALQNVYYGLSLGSVLLLAAVGLAITFGVMGVINMAHGEMIMLGAYTAYVVQQLLLTYAPGLMTLSLPFAIPAAFIVAGFAGILVERFIIRFLYGRPLETLLATWGLSLIIQQAVRTVFGPTNKPVEAPAWMSGSFDLGHLAITYSRLWIIVFAMVVLALLMTFLKRTHFGMQMRAVTQNRKMAAAMGVRTNKVDALTFGLGSGVAGIAGVALSQIDNVSPNLGQSYIIDSFMVVVFGGVGNLWGTLVGAMSLGVANKFLEPYAGAVFAKIIVLVLIILFIQRRPRGLFALKGRAVEA